MPRLRGRWSLQVGAEACHVSRLGQPVIWRVRREGGPRERPPQRCGDLHAGRPSCRHIVHGITSSAQTSTSNRWSMPQQCSPRSAAARSLLVTTASRAPRSRRARTASLTPGYSRIRRSWCRWLCARYVATNASISSGSSVNPRNCTRTGVPNPSNQRASGGTDPRCVIMVCRYELRMSSMESISVPSRSKRKVSKVTRWRGCGGSACRCTRGLGSRQSWRWVAWRFRRRRRVVVRGPRTPPASR